LVTSQRKERLPALGVDWLLLKKKFPKLAHVGIIGDMKNSAAPGHDLNYQALAGFVAPPALPRALVADYMTAERVVQAALLARIDLLQKRKQRRCATAQASEQDL
jgi:crotonobetainyl-CoA:carnitine CoA-transferase CaiB-like acyl-CoA transferase